MKSDPMAYAEYLYSDPAFTVGSLFEYLAANNTFTMADLYTVTLASNEALRWADFDTDIVHPLNGYTLSLIHISEPTRPY